MQNANALQRYVIGRNHPEAQNIVVTARRRNYAVVRPYILLRIRTNVAVTHHALNPQVKPTKGIQFPQPEIGFGIRSFLFCAKGLYAAALGIEILCIAAFCLRTIQLSFKVSRPNIVAKVTLVTDVKYS